MMKHLWATGLFVGLLSACGPNEDTAGTAGAGGQSTGGAGPGGNGSGAGGGGAAAPIDLACKPLPPPQGAVVDGDPGQANELPDLVSGAAAGTTLVLTPGTYAVPSSLHIAADNVTLRSSTDKASDVVIDGQYAVNEIVVITASNVTVAHVTVTRAVDHPIHIYPPSPDIKVQSPLLYGLALIDGGEQFIKVNPAGGTGYVDEGRVECSTFLMTDEGRLHVEPCCGGCYTGGIDVHEGWKWQVRNNHFEGIYCDTGLAEHAIHFWKGSRDTLVEDNIIVNCARGIGFGLGGGGGVRLYPDNPYNDPSLAHYDGIIRNNIVYGDIPGFDTGIELDEAKEPQCLHNTVLKGPNASGFFSGIDYRFAQTSAVIRNNLVTKITQRDGAMGQVDTNVTDPPDSYFVDPANIDFHLSPEALEAIDKGAALDNAGVDIDGEPHTQGGGPDIGADERMPTP